MFFCEIAKSDLQVRHDRLSVCLSTRNYMAHTGRIFIKSDTRGLCELTIKFKFH